MSELSGWQDGVGPLFEIAQSEVVSGGDDSDFVDSAQKLNDDFLGSMVIDDLEFSDIAVLLHDFQESQKYFGRRSDYHLFLSLSFGVDDSLEAICQDVSSGHFCGL